MREIGNGGKNAAEITHRKRSLKPKFGETFHEAINHPHGSSIKCKM